MSMNSEKEKWSLTDQAEEFIPDGISLKINSAKKPTDLMNYEVFAGKSGDSLTLMNTHGWVLEPDINALKNNKQILYNHHEKNILINKVKDYKNENTWKNISKSYINILEEITTNGKKPARL